MRPVCGIVLLIAALTAAGCAEKWEKPGGTQAEFDAMKYGCSAQAYAQFPPLIRQQQITAGHYTPVTTHCSGFGYSYSCFQSGGQWVAPVVITVDDNDPARGQAVRSCFMQNGWRRAKDQPVAVAAPVPAPAPTPPSAAGNSSPARGMTLCISPQGTDVLVATPQCPAGMRTPS